MTGKWPNGSVDHINRDKMDNRWENLRLADKGQNAANTGLRKSNSSGFKGVSWHHETQAWRAQIRAKGQKLHLGTFSTKEAAAVAYNQKAIEIWGEYAHIAGDSHG